MGLLPRSMHAAVAFAHTHLLVAKDEVDPVVQVFRHVGALERLAMALDEAPRVLSAPGRQNDVVDRRLVLTDTKVVPVDVDQKLGKVEELGDELKDARRVRGWGG